MNETEFAFLKQELAAPRRGHRVQRLLLSTAAAAIVGLALVVLGGPHSVSAQSTTDAEGILHVRGLVVEDPSGHERVRLGAPLPDPMIHGVRRKRSGVISGLLISDANGNERGGYVTFLANPKGGVNFDIYDSKGNEAQITVFPPGPRFTMTKAKEKIVELPAAPR